MAQRRATSIARRAMGRTRQSAVVVMALAFVAILVVVDRSPIGGVESVGSELSAVPEFRRDAKASTWFCPGVVGNDDSIGGSLIIANAGETPVGGTITRFFVDGDSRQQRFAVPARSSLEVDALAGVSSPFVSALVESHGTAVAVEQRTTHRAGNAIASCASAPADSWFLADGFTGDDSIDNVVVTNPSLDSAILDISFVTSIGERSPQSLKGVVIPPESVRVFDLASLDARNEAIAAVSVRASVGRVVVGRSQHYLGRGRLGYTMTLASSLTSNRWYFADGEKAAGVAEEYVIYNPSMSDQQLTFIVAGDDGVAIDPIVVTASANRVTKFAPADLGALPEGRYSVIVSAVAAFSGAGLVDGVVIERVTTRPQGKTVASAVLLGSPLAARSWIAPAGVTIDVLDSLRVFNPGSQPATFRVTYLGPAGDVSVTGYEEVSLAPGASTSVQLGAQTATSAVSVIANEPVVVQRRVPRGAKQPVSGVAPLIRVVEAGAS
ncbi:MAG: DUF5719 family protein [Ilumatobacteraceae bacterium]